MPIITNFSFQLNDVDIEAISTTPFDLAVVESGYVGHDPETLQATPGFVAQLPPQEDGRLMLAYLNASVTDHNRAYWPDESSDWLTPPVGDPTDLDTGTPTWVTPGPRVPDWLENNRGIASGPEDGGDGIFGFIVDWSQPDWQDRVIAEAVYLVEQGYNGIFLDDVGRYMANYFYETPEDDAPEFDQFGYPIIDRATLAQYASEMMALVTAVGAAIRQVDSDAYLLINSGLDIVDHANLTGSDGATDYYAAVNGFLMETQYAASVDGDEYDPWAIAQTLFGNGTDLFALESAETLDDVTAFYEWAQTEGILALATPSTAYANPPAVPPGTPEPVDNSGDDSITGTFGYNNIQGGAGNDTITGEGYPDAIFGGAGDDEISGGRGGDTLVGGPGNDTISVTELVLGTYEYQYIYDEEEDLVLPGLGHDVILGTQGTTFTDFSDDYNYYASAILSYRDLSETGGLTLHVSPNSDYTEYFNEDFREFVGTVQSADGRVDDIFTPVRTLEGSQDADLFELEANVDGKFLVGHAGADVFNLGLNASATLRYDREAAFNPNAVGIEVDFSTNTVTDTYGDVDQFSGDVFVTGTEHGDLFDLRGAESVVELPTGDGDDTVLGGAESFVAILSEGADHVSLGTGGGEIRLTDWLHRGAIKTIDLIGLGQDSEVIISFSSDSEEISFDGDAGTGFVGQTQVVEFENIDHLKAGNGTLGYVLSQYYDGNHSFMNMGNSRIAVIGDLADNTIHVQGDAPELSLELGITAAIDIDLAGGEFSSFGYGADADPTVTGNAAITTLVVGADNRIATEFDSGRDAARITGSQADETLEFVSAGADTLVGGDGEDTLDYSGFAYLNGQDTLHRVSINLAAGTAQTPEQYEYSRDFHFNGSVGFYSEYFDPTVSTQLLNQQISEFENVIGTVGDDEISGDQFSNMLAGGEGDDILVGSSMDALDPAAEKIYRLYQATLDRTPDTGGFTNWTNQLQTGAQTFQNVAHGFVASSEFSNVYGALNNTEFVTLLYNNVLDRQPELVGLNAWVARLAEGASRAQIVIGFSESAEFKSNTGVEASAFANALAGRAQTNLLDDVFRLYQATLDRAPDQAGLEAWTSRLAEGQAYTAIAAGFTNSAEFQNTYGALDTEGFVRLLYQNVLNRDPDTAGLENWTRVINEGGSREDVVRGFAQSPEFTQNTQSTFMTYMRSLDGDVLEGGAGNDILAAGYAADTFIFDAEETGADIVLQIEAWDTLQFNGFDYDSDADVLAHTAVLGSDIVFSDQGVTIQFSGANQTTLEALDYVFV